MHMDNIIPSVITDLLAISCTSSPVPSIEETYESQMLVQLVCSKCSLEVAYLIIESSIVNASIWMPKNDVATSHQSRLATPPISDFSFYALYFVQTVRISTCFHNKYKSCIQKKCE